MFTLQIQDDSLQQQLAELLQKEFNGNPDAMLQEFLTLYQSRLKRANYSGIIQWEQDGLAFQKEIRSEW